MTDFFHKKSLNWNPTKAFIFYQAILELHFGDITLND